MTATVIDLDAVAAVLDRVSTPSTRVVLVPIARFDRRAVAAVQHAQSIPAAERLAVHVVETTAGADELELSWLCSGIDVPLELIHTSLELGDALVDATEECLRCGATEVVVVVGRQLLRRRWERLLHDRSGETISERLGQVPGVLPVVVAVAAT